jgi:nitrate reductase gamma subunit
MLKTFIGFRLPKFHYVVLFLPAWHIGCLPCSNWASAVSCVVLKPAQPVVFVVFLSFLCLVGANIFLAEKI